MIALFDVTDSDMSASSCPRSVGRMGRTASTAVTINRCHATHHSPAGADLADTFLFLVGGGGFLVVSPGRPSPLHGWCSLLPSE